MRSMDFLQSEAWRRFQEAAGRQTFLVGETSIIEHKLPIVGSYFYLPRASITQDNITEIIKLAKKEKAGWIRFDASDSHSLDLIRSNSRVLKAPHDMQPKEVFVIDITRTEKELLTEMKPKTRYNIRLAEKKGVTLRITNSYEYTNKDINEFLKLVKVTARRDGITPHADAYYRKMFEVIPGDILKLYAAEYENKVIAANLIYFYADTATYLHGASDNEHRNVMAPYLLQWKAIVDAKNMGCIKYDFGGIKTKNVNNSWAGITRFKMGFSPKTKPIEFPGSYDIIINPLKYNLYKILQSIRALF